MSVRARRAPHAAAGQLPEYGAHSDGRLRHALPQRWPQRGGVRDVDAGLHKQRALPRVQRRWRQSCPSHELEQPGTTMTTARPIHQWCHGVALTALCASAPLTHKRLATGHCPAQPEEAMHAQQ